MKTEAARQRRRHGPIAPTTFLLIAGFAMVPAAMLGWRDVQATQRSDEIDAALSELIAAEQLFAQRDAQNRFTDDSSRLKEVVPEIADELSRLAEKNLTLRLDAGDRSVVITVIDDDEVKVRQTIGFGDS